MRPSAVSVVSVSCEFADVSAENNAWHLPKRPRTRIASGDKRTGRLTSRPFTIADPNSDYLTATLMELLHLLMSMSSSLMWLVSRNGPSARSPRSSMNLHNVPYARPTWLHVPL